MSPSSASDLDLSEDRHVSLCEALDRVITTGVVVAGDAVISVADIELIYLNLRLMLTSIETAMSPLTTSDTAIKTEVGR